MAVLLSNIVVRYVLIAVDRVWSQLMTYASLSDRGKVVVQHKMMCGKCSTEEVVALQKRMKAVEYFTSRGWMKLRFHGYVCPECAKTGE